MSTLRVTLLAASAAASMMMIANTTPSYAFLTGQPGGSGRGAYTDQRVGGSDSSAEQRQRSRNIIECGRATCGSTSGSGGRGKNGSDLGKENGKGGLNDGEK